MKTLIIVIISLFTFYIAFTDIGSDKKADEILKIAVMPFKVKGLSQEDAVVLRANFVTALLNTNRFEILSDDEINQILKSTEFSNLANCNYAECIADFGKVVGAKRVVHISVQKRGKLYTTKIRVVESKDAEDLFYETNEFSGEYEEYSTKTIPDLANNLSGKELESIESYRWFIIGATVAGIGAIIYFVYKSLDQTFSGEGGESDKPLTEH